MPTPVEIQSMALQVQAALTRLGYCYRPKDGGGTMQVIFRKLQRAEDRYVLLEVDPHRLPPKIKIADLESPAVLGHLSAVLGRPVQKLNSVGLTYVVVLQPPPKAKPLPATVRLPQRPDGIRYAWPLGVDGNGQDVWTSLDASGHILITGATNAGKSTALNVGLISLFEQHTPDELQVLLIDPKALEMAGYAGLAHLAIPVANTLGTAATAIAWLEAEVDRRQAIMAGVARSLESYNARSSQPIPRLLVVIDEIVSLVLGWGGVRSEPFRRLISITVKARALGVSLIFAGQSARADILDLVREQCGLKIGLRLETPYASKAAIGRYGAEELPSKTPGRCIVVGLGNRAPVTLQGYWLPEKDIDARQAGLVSQQPCPLSAVEQALVAYAVGELSGAFNLTALYNAHKDSQHHISWRKLKELAARWAACGWLLPAADATTARLVSPELARTAGIVEHAGDVE